MGKLSHTIRGGKAPHGGGGLEARFCVPKMGFQCRVFYELSFLPGKNFLMWVGQLVGAGCLGPQMTPQPHKRPGTILERVLQVDKVAQ